MGMIKKLLGRRNSHDKNNNSKLNNAYNNVNKKANISNLENIDSLITYIELDESNKVSEIINQMKNNEILLLVSRIENQSKEIIEVYNENNEYIGKCNKNVTDILAPRIDAGINYYGEILEITKTSNSQNDLQARIIKGIPKPSQKKKIKLDSLFASLSDEFITEVIDVTFDDRQKLISNMKKGDVITLIKEPHDKHTYDTIGVYDKDNNKLGYIEDELSKKLIIEIDKGNVYTSQVTEMLGGGIVSFGLKININKVDIKLSNQVYTKEVEIEILNYIEKTSDAKIAKDLIYMVGRRPIMLTSDNEWSMIMTLVAISEVFKENFKNYIHYPNGNLLVDINVFDSYAKNKKREIFSFYEIYNNLIQNIYRFEYGEEDIIDSTREVNMFKLKSDLRPLSPISYSDLEKITLEMIENIFTTDGSYKEFINNINKRIINIKEIILNISEEEIKRVNQRWIEELKQRRLFLKDIEWIGTIRGIECCREVRLDYDSFPSLLYNESLYNKSHYVCPRCEKMVLYQLKVSAVYTVYKNVEKLLVHNIFTCPDCRTFYASAKTKNESDEHWTETNLSEFALKSDTYSKEEYNDLISYSEKIYFEEEK
ncbi:HIRAN domain-containing protein [Romboutsia lituseburensis]|uniref:HIRAN domain-containing protein n=1 Tax=Romboutsia lituseburensis TaxID=1537 RepID=UPI00215AAC15|nr:HIRAN domain-containing protein [Romboutsia lituseburensis]MCR8745475.1 HIRAN domain-containing protein [Romboutsia lituseburensis]